MRFETTTLFVATHKMVCERADTISLPSPASDDGKIKRSYWGLHMQTPEWRDDIRRGLSARWRQSTRVLPKAVRNSGLAFCPGKRGRPVDRVRHCTALPHLASSGNGQHGFVRDFYAPLDAVSRSRAAAAPAASSGGFTLSIAPPPSQGISAPEM